MTDVSDGNTFGVNLPICLTLKNLIKYNKDAFIGKGLCFFTFLINTFKNTNIKLFYFQ